MPKSYPETLVLTRRVLAGLIALNVLVGLFIFALLIATIVAADPVMNALGLKGAISYMGIRAVMVMGILGVLITHVVLTGLRAIVETVKHGTPFVAENAARLQTMGWAVLGLEAVHIAIVLIANAISSQQLPINVKLELSLTRLLVVLLLFVLAGVFEQGSRMREDLEGTV